MHKYNVPQHLKHKPIYAVNGYAEVDGYYKHDTDVVGLSVGKAQWSDDVFVPAVKVWRRTKKRWSRQSEETTVTRALDMATLVIKVLDKHYHGKDFDSITCDGIALEIEDMSVDAFTAQAFASFLEENRNDIHEHILPLYSALTSYMDCVKQKAHANH